MAEHDPMPMCPMAETCKSMMSGRIPGMIFAISGIVFIALGLAVIVEPQILIWLVGLLFVVMGCMTFLCARFMQRFVQQIRKSGE